MSTRLTEALNRHLSDHPVIGDGWIFTYQGKPIPPYTQTTLWKRIRSDAGVPCRFHDLRHSCASQLLDSGATVAEVRDILGHQSITTTEQYLHTDRNALANRISLAFG